MTVTLRPMAAADIPSVAQLETELFGEEAWSPGMLAEELAGTAGSRHYRVATDDHGAVCGYAGLAAVAGQADVVTLAVAADRWGAGIGTALLCDLLSEAGRRGCTEVFLEVRVDNMRAQRLYQRNGFTGIGIRRGYYQPSGADALVMRCEVRANADAPGGMA